MAEAGRERLRVHARGDEDRGAGVTQFVEPNPLSAEGLAAKESADGGDGPCLIGAEGERSRIERPRFTAAEDESASPRLSKAGAWPGGRGAQPRLEPCAYRRGSWARSRLRVDPTSGAHG